MARGDKFYSKSYYNPKVHGSLEDYLKKHDGISSFPLFNRYRYYKMLYYKGYLEPNVSIIRIMNNIGSDEHYLVFGKNSLKGIVTGGLFDGRKGRHNAKRLLKKSAPFEAQHLSI